MRYLSLVAILLFTLVACGGAPDAATTDTASAPESSAGSSPPGATTASGPCDRLTAAEIADALGTDASLVGGGASNEYGSGFAADCVWEVVHDGLEDTVTLWMREAGEKSAPDAWDRVIQGYLDNGETFGSVTITHEPADLGGATGGTLSAVIGSAFVKSRIYSWHVDNQTLYRLTLARSLEDGGDLPDPPAETFDALVRGVMN
ncbi:MAG: hypothetical protein AAGD38_11790 [Acidobacteriota bacterium]